MADSSYIGKGKVEIEDYPLPATPTWIDLGNCNELKLGVDEEVKDLMDYTTTGGGLANSISRVKQVTAEMSLHDLNADNLALALRGTVTTGTGNKVIEALTAPQGEYVLRFTGLNEARSGKSVDVLIHRIKFSPLKDLSLIGDDFASLKLSGKLLSDSSQTGTGVSRFFKITLAD